MISWPLKKSSWIKLAYAIKPVESIISQKLGSRNFSQISNSFLNKGKVTVSPLLKCFAVLTSVSDKAKVCAEIFSADAFSCCK